MGDAVPGRNGVMGTELRPVTGSSSSSRRLSYAELALRVCVLVMAVISVSLIASDGDFHAVPAFNYLLATGILAVLYQAVQIVIIAIHMARCGRPFMGSAFYIYFTIAADLICCLLLLSGSSAAFGVTTGYNYTDNFVAQANGAASLALVAFLFALPLVVLSFNRYAVDLGRK